MLERWWTALLPLLRWVPDPLTGLLMWIFNAKFTVGAAAVVFNDQGEVMLFKHTYRRNFPWALPGGWLKYGEDPARAVQREIMEESGLSVYIERPVQVTTVGRMHNLLDIVFVGRLTGGTFRPSAEVSEAGFFRLDHLPRVHKDTLKLLKGVMQPQEK
jgi:8-oxo-dGTP diphosphatase